MGTMINRRRVMMSTFNSYDLELYKSLIDGSLSGDIIVPNITSIKYGAFAYCSGLTSVEIPNSVTSIGNSAFEGCTGLTSVTIPDSVTSIGGYTFQNCRQLSKVNSEIDGKCVINNTISVINVGLFRYDKFTEIIIPDSVTTINDSAFCDSSTLTTVTIGNGIKAIYNGVFIRCSSLTSFTILATTPPSIGANSLSNTSANLKIYVPAESVEAYKTKAGWSRHASKIQAIPTT